jgi:hypothetical protein
MARKRKSKAGKVEFQIPNQMKRVFFFCDLILHWLQSFHDLLLKQSLTSHSIRESSSLVAQNRFPSLSAQPALHAHDAKKSGQCARLLLPGS